MYILGLKTYPFCPKIPKNAPLLAGPAGPASGTPKGPLSRVFVYAHSYYRPYREWPPWVATPVSGPDSIIVMEPLWWKKVLVERVCSYPCLLAYLNGGCSHLAFLEFILFDTFRCKMMKIGLTTFLHLLTLQCSLDTCGHCHDLPDDWGIWLLDSGGLESDRLHSGDWILGY